MESYDCVVLYNAANISEREGCEEKIYPANIVREEVSAIEESLRDGGYRPYVFAVENFSQDLIRTLDGDFAAVCIQPVRRDQRQMRAGDVRGGPARADGHSVHRLGSVYPGPGAEQISCQTDFARGRHSHGAGAMCAIRDRTLTIPRGMRFPLIVKPARQDASLGINSNSVCHCAGAAGKADPLYSRGLRPGSTGRRVSRREGIQCLRRRGSEPGGAGHFRNRFYRTAGR